MRRTSDFSDMGFDVIRLLISEMPSERRRFVYKTRLTSDMPSAQTSALMSYAGLLGSGGSMRSGCKQKQAF